MQAYIGIFVLCVISGALSCAVNEIQSKEGFHRRNVIKAFTFYVIIFYTILSLFKTVLGYGTLTLTATFDDVSWRTYLHYSLPLIVISVVIPFIVKMILREKASDFIEMAVSLIIGIYSIVYLVFGKNNNIMTVCIVFAGLLLSLIIVYCYKKEVQYCTRQNVKERLALEIPVILLWIITMVLYLPNELYLSNVYDMMIPYSIFIRTLLLGSLAYFAVYTILLVYFLTQKQFMLVCEIIFAITVAGYLQGVILNGTLNIMDGTRQSWSVITMVVNALIWLVIIGISVSLRYIVKKVGDKKESAKKININKIFSVICIYLSLIQLVTWVYLGITTQNVKAENDYELTTEGRFELSPDHNVIVFVLDWFDVQIMDRMLEAEADFLEPLQDFTWYKNTTSLYAYTAMSVPYLLTDVEWEYDMDEAQYREYAFQNSTILRDIADQNYNIGVYTAGKFVSESVSDIVINYSNLTVQGWNHYRILDQMIKCSKYRNYPFAMKGAYWYTGGQISEDLLDASVHNASDDEPFYEELTNDRIQIAENGNYDGTYRFYHLLGVHPPFNPDMLSQGKYCMNIVYEYLQQLKDAGVYDDATIIITADHGQNYLAAGYEKQLSKYDFSMASSPILFVKKSHQTNEDGMNMSMAPVSHAQMAATIMEAVNGDTLNYGETFDDIEEDRQWERYLTLRRHDTKEKNIINYAKYAINGYVGDWNNWSAVSGN